MNRIINDDMCNPYMVSVVVIITGPALIFRKGYITVPYFERSDLFAEVGI